MKKAQIAELSIAEIMAPQTANIVIFYLTNTVYTKPASAVIFLHLSSLCPIPP
jgi:hypothetical protein